MTAHTLAKRLLEMPDLHVVLRTVKETIATIYVSIDEQYVDLDCNCDDCKEQSN